MSDKLKRACSVSLPIEPSQFTSPTSEVKSKNLRSVSLAEQLAGSSMMYRNYYWSGWQQHVPTKAELQTVDKYFPYAKDGPLFVDEPQLDWQIKKCEEKTAVIRRAGHRYLVLKPGMTFTDAQLQLFYATECLKPKKKGGNDVVGNSNK